jgi:hypothetical protein
MMPFRYSAFLSYRHPKGSLAARFVASLYDSLAAELELLVPEPMFFDQYAFKDKEFSDQALAEALCTSVCMIFVYSPVLYDEERPYCAIEYNAMKILEKHRLEALPPDERRYGLILPIILRGREMVPAEIWEQRQCLDFSGYLGSHSLKRRSDYAQRVRGLADYIARRCEVFRALPHDLFSEDESFALPDREEVIRWIHQNKPGAPKLPPFSS